MKILFYALVACSLCVVSCSETNKKEVSTDNADTAVLVTDTANRLNASPVNDTTIPNGEVPVQH